MVNCCECFQYHIPSIQSATGHPSLCTTCVHSLGQLYSFQLEGIVQFHTAGVRKCRSRQIFQHCLVNCCERFYSHTPSVQGATRTPSLCTTCVQRQQQLYFTRLEGTIKIHKVSVRKVLWDLPVCIQLVYTAYKCCRVSDLREPNRSIQRVYENAVHARLFHTAW